MSQEPQRSGTAFIATAGEGYMSLDQQHQILDAEEKKQNEEEAQARKEAEKLTQKLTGTQPEFTGVMTLGGHQPSNQQSDSQETK